LRAPLARAFGKIRTATPTNDARQRRAAFSRALPPFSIFSQVVFVRPCGCEPSRCPPASSLAPAVALFRVRVAGVGPSLTATNTLGNRYSKKQQNKKHYFLPCYFGES
jgi:hypothetical protein